jgi:hypothetical protein
MGTWHYVVGYGVALALAGGLAASGCAGSSDTSPGTGGGTTHTTTHSTSTGGSGGTIETGGGGSGGGTGGGGPCVQGDTQPCYSGDPGLVGVGECVAGVQTCDGQGTWGDCVGEVLPVDEVCNGLDDDCDGVTDQGIADVTCGLGICQVTVPGCDNGQPVQCVPGQPLPNELCNGVDDNCNGTVDENCPCINGDTQPCYSGDPSLVGIGECVAGVQTCDLQGVWGSCVGEVLPAPDVCNGLDDNCDGGTDTGIPAVTCGVGACQATVPGCVNGQVPPCVPGQPQAETCNGLDDDCNGVVDDGLGSTQCGVGACQVMVENCVNGQPQNCVPGQPSAEICGNGIDEDCDGTPDNGCAPVNDLRANATPIDMAAALSNLAATTVAATNNTGNCFCTGGPDVFFIFTLAQAELVYADTAGASWDTSLYFQDSNGANIAATGLPAGGATCNDDNGLGCSLGLQSAIFARLAAGTYYLVLSGCESGAATIHFQHLPVGNGPLAALPAGTNATAAGTTSGAGVYTTTCGYSTGPDNTYYWQTCPAYAGGAFSASLCGAAAWDTILEQRSATRAPVAVCNDDSCSSLQSAVGSTIPAGAGIHTLVIDGYNGAAGPYTITYTRP